MQMSSFRQIWQNNTPKDNDAWTQFVKISSWVDNRGQTKRSPPEKGKANSAELCGTSQLINCTCSTLKAQSISPCIGVPQWSWTVLESFWGGKKQPSEKTGFINSIDYRNICSPCCPISSDALTSESHICSPAEGVFLSALFFIYLSLLNINLSVFPALL